MEYMGLNSRFVTCKISPSSPSHWAVARRGLKILFISIDIYASSRMNSLTAIITVTVRIYTVLAYALLLLCFSSALNEYVYSRKMQTIHNTQLEDTQTYQQEQAHIQTHTHTHKWHDGFLNMIWAVNNVLIELLWIHGVINTSLAVNYAACDHCRCLKLWQKKLIW